MDKVDKRMLLKTSKHSPDYFVQRFLFNQLNIVFDESFFDYELLKMSLIEKHTTIAKLLVGKGCKVRNPNKLNCEDTPLHLAMKLNDFSLVSIILLNGGSIYDKNHEGEMPIYTAFKQGCYDVVDKLLDYISNCCYDLLHKDNEDDVVHFHIACVRNHLNSVKLFSELGFDVNSRLGLDSAEFSGLNPLHYAINNGYSELFQILLNHNGDLSIKNHEGLTPLHIFYYKYYKLNSNSSIFLFKSKDELMYAFVHGNETKFINSMDCNRVTYFHLCCSINYPNLVQVFIDNGVDVNSCISLNCSVNPGFSPLHFAVKHNCTQVVKLLLKHGADCKKADKYGITPLHLSCVNFKTKETVKIIKMLLDHKACPTVVDKMGYAPIHHVFNNLFKQIITNYSDKEGKIIYDMLMSNVPLNTNLIDSDGISLFHMACTRNDINQVNDFLDSGVIIDSSVVSGKFSGYTALHFAILFNQKDVVEVLLKRNAQVNIKTNQLKDTPLHLACEYSWVKFYELRSKYKLSNSNLNWSLNRRNQFDIIKTLLLHGADINAKDSSGISPLLVACTINEFNYCKLDWPVSFKDKLINEINTRMRKIIKILFSNKDACLNKTSILPFISKLKLLNISDKFVKCLIALGIDIDAVDDEGLTPLHFAVEYQKRDMLLSLLNHKANVNAKCKNSRTPLELAIEICYMRKDYDEEKKFIANDFCIILLENGCDVNARYQNSTLLHHAIKNNNIALVQKLLYYGADINMEDSCGYSVICSLPKFDILHNRYDLYKYMNLITMICIHVQKLLALGLYVSKKIKQFCINSHKYCNSLLDAEHKIKNLENIFNDCMEEVNRLKLKKIDSYTSLYNYLLKDQDGLSIHVKNSNLIRILEEVEIDKEFPLYSYLLKVQLRKGLIRYDFLKSAKVSFHFATGISLPDPCFYSIFKYLTNEEISNLNAAVGMKLSYLKKSNSII